MAEAAFDRARALERLGTEAFDVLVIGGGATGAGVALDAATRGMRTALVERGDFAAGTSSKSSKLIHGGIRYLAQGDVKLVYQALTERRRLLRNAPHLVRILGFMLPIYRQGGLIPRFFARGFGLVLWFYDLTGGALVVGRHRRLSTRSGSEREATARKALQRSMRRRYAGVQRTLLWTELFGHAVAAPSGVVYRCPTRRAADSARTRVLLCR